MICFLCSTVESLSGVAAKELFKYSEEELVEKLGEDEGKRLHNELQVQIGAMTVSGMQHKHFILQIDNYSFLPLKCQTCFQRNKLTKTLRHRANSEIRCIHLHKI